MSGLQEQLQRVLAVVTRAACAHARRTTHTGTWHTQGAISPLAAVQHALHTVSAALQPISASHRGGSASAWRQQQHCASGGSRGFAAGSAATAEEDSGIVFLPQAVKRLQELKAESPGAAGVLRLLVEGGGCSGYSYLFSLEDAAKPEDRVFEGGGVQLVVDPVSFEFVRGSSVDYTTDIIRSAFEVVTNPNAETSCGCGSSFAPKD